MSSLCPILCLVLWAVPCSKVSFSIVLRDFVGGWWLCVLCKLNWSWKLCCFPPSFQSNLHSCLHVTYNFSKRYGWKLLELTTWCISKKCFIDWKMVAKRFIVSLPKWEPLWHLSQGLKLYMDILESNMCVVRNPLSEPIAVFTSLAFVYILSFNQFFVTHKESTCCGYSWGFAWRPWANKTCTWDGWSLELWRSRLVDWWRNSNNFWLNKLHEI